MREDHSATGARLSRRRFLQSTALLAAGGLGAAACSYVGPGEVNLIFGVTPRRSPMR
jgi:nitrous oxide reductase